MQYYSEDKMKEIRLAFEEEVLNWAGVKTKKMFGCPAYQVNGKLFAFLVTGGIVITLLGETDRDILFEDHEATPFRTDKRTMKNWPRVPVEGKKSIESVLQFVTISHTAGLLGATPGKKPLNKKSIQEVAQSMEVTPELLPYIPELLADLWVLGSSPGLIVEFLRSCNLPRRTALVLELGCGKGAVAITLAKELDVRVLAVDCFKPFLKEARRRAKDAGVADLIRFEYADMHDTIRESGEFDAVVYAAVGGVLGDCRQCVGELRKTVSPGGYIVIDDGFLSGTEKLERPGYEHYVTYDETIQQLTSHGDKLMGTKILASDAIEKINRRNNELIRKRAEKLAQDHPELAESLDWYVKNQEEECEVLETAITGAVWLLRKTS